MGKKNEYVFNIGFNKNNPEHKAAADLLNRMGHTKADYIAKAVLLYNAKGSTALGNGGAIDYQTIEQIVRKMLKEQTERSEQKKFSNEEGQLYHQEEKKERKNLDMKFDEEDMSNVLQTLQGFRQ